MRGVFGNAMARKTHSSWARLTDSSLYWVKMLLAH